MKAIKLITCSFALAMVMAACNSDSTNSNVTTDSTTMHTDSNLVTTPNTNTDGSLTNFDNNSRQFIEDAAHGGNMEITMGNTAMNSSNQKIKEIGKMLVDDHTEMNQKLKDLVAKKGGQVPAGLTSDQQKSVDEINGKSGADFDNAYLNMLIEDHKKDIQKFTDASKNLADEDLKNFAKDGIPILQKHLDKIMDAQKNK